MIVFTTAPEAYDYNYVTTLETFECPQIGRDGTLTWRQIQIDADEYTCTYQCRRYGSGMHPVWEEDPREEYQKYIERQKKENAEIAEAKTFLANASIEELKDAMYHDKYYRWIRFDDYKRRVAEKEREALNVRLDAEYEKWSSHPVSKVKHVFLLERREIKETYSFSDGLTKERELVLNPTLLCANLKLERNHEQVHFTTTSGTNFLKAEKGHICPEKLSIWFNKGWAVEVKEIHPARLQDSLREVYSTTLRGETYWVLSPRYGSDNVQVYANDGSKVRGRSKLEKAILEQDRERFLPSTHVMVEFED